MDKSLNSLYIWQNIYTTKSTAPTGIKFDLQANNHEVIASSQVYTDESACHKGIEGVRNNAPEAAIDTRETK